MEKADNTQRAHLMLLMLALVMGSIVVWALGPVKGMPLLTAIAAVGALHLAVAIGAGAQKEYRTIGQRALDAAAEIRNKLQDPAAILDAATSGRIRQIFVSDDGPAGNTETLNRAVVEGLRTGAEIYSVSGKDLAGLGPIVAVPRY